MPEKSTVLSALLSLDCFLLSYLALDLLPVQSFALLLVRNAAVSGIGLFWIPQVILLLCAGVFSRLIYHWVSIAFQEQPVEDQITISFIALLVLFSLMAWKFGFFSTLF